jgi:hypothetical protein
MRLIRGLVYVGASAGSILVIALIELTIGFPAPLEASFLASLGSALSVVFSGAVLAAIVGGIFQVVQKRSEARESMWKIADEYMRKYYVPIVSVTNDLSDTVSLWKANQEDSILLTLFYLFAKFRSLGGEMVKATSLFLLTRYKAEECADILFRQINEAPGFSDLELSRLSSLTEADLTIDALDERIQNDSETERLFAKFCSWVKGKPKDFEFFGTLSDLFSSLLVIEFNRLYRAWYGYEFRAPEGQSLKEIARFLGVN